MTTYGLTAHDRMLLFVTGVRVDPLDLRPEDIDIRDIAHALSRQCRYNGHVYGFLSVARHSIWVAELLLDATGDARLALEGLHHDDSETYLGDMVRPLKHRPEMYEYIEAENRAQRIIAKTLGLPYPASLAVKIADTLACHLEILFHCQTYEGSPQADAEDWLTAHHAFTDLLDSE